MSKESNIMFHARIRSIAISAAAATAFATVAFGLATAPAVTGAGLRNCVDVSGPQSGRVGCYEDVWADGSQVRVTFSNTRFTGATPDALAPFYVLAPQTDKPQGAPPNTFPHDHVIRSVPQQNHGDYSVKMQSFFVLCSGQGIVGGSCIPAWTTVGSDQLPFAKSVNGHSLTSTEAIESAASAGDLALINLGPGAVIVGAVSSGD
jgi:hypothetical protein